MGDSEAGLLPGERLLWTGRPVRARVIPEDLLLPGLLLVALLALAAGFGSGALVNEPGGLADQVLALAAVLAALIGATVRALRIKPGELRRTVYQVTDRRVLTTTGPRRTWAAFLDQLAEPVVVPRRDGTADLSLRMRADSSLIPGANLLAGFSAVGVVAFGYPAAGRVLRRRARIKRSVYIVTSQRLITTWDTSGRTAGTQASLTQLLPPQVENGSVFTHLASPSAGSRRNVWAQLMWPAARTEPPQLIGLPDPRAVADLICSAQLAGRVRARQPRKPRTRGDQ